MKLLKDKLLVAGPGITQTDLLELLDSTGKKFKDGKWAYNRKASSKKGRKSVPGRKSKGGAKILKDTTPGGTRQPLSPLGGI